MVIPVYSDRGKISDLNKEKDCNIDITSCENRLKKLYMYALLHRDSKLLESLGFITTDYIGDKKSIGLSIVRIKQIINDIRSKVGSKIDEFAKKLSNCFKPKPDEIIVENFWQRKGLIKQATANKPPSFRRVI